MAFNVLDFVKGSTYPEKESHLYTNGRAAYELAETDDTIRRLEREIDTLGDRSQASELIEELKTAQSKRQGLIEELEEGKITVFLKGFPEHTRLAAVKVALEDEDIKSIESEADRGEAISDRISAMAIQKVVGPDGSEDTEPMTGPRLREILNSLPRGGEVEFIQDLQSVVLDSLTFESDAIANFS